MDKILLIQLGRMGDLVQTFPLLQRLRQGPSAGEITLVCLREFQAVVQNQPLFDRLVAMELRDVRKLCEDGNQQNFWNLPPFCEITEFADPYDLVVNLTHDEGSAVLCEKINGRRKSGRIRASPDEIRLLGDWSKYLFAAVKNRTQNLFNLVDIYVGMGGAWHQRTTHYVKVSGAGEEAEALALLRQGGYRAKGRLVAFQMGASESHRAWPAEKFAALAQHLRAEPEVEIVLVGNQKEAALGESFDRFAANPIINLIGKTEVHQLPALLKLCELLVSNDTGTIHIAAGVGTRTVGLYFSTAYYAETAPYGEGHLVLQVESQSSRGEPPKFSPGSSGAEFLPIEAVLAASRRILGRREILPLDGSQLALYESKFLSNGTLLYVPVEGTGISPNYTAAFLNRLMWEKALGLESDEAFLAGFLARLFDSTDFKPACANLRRSLSSLRAKLADGAKCAREMTAQLTQALPVEGRMEALRSQLEETVKQCSAGDKSAGLLLDFFHFEMMDLDYLAPRDLAVELERKFLKLERFSAFFLEILQRIEVRN